MAQETSLRDIWGRKTLFHFISNPSNETIFYDRWYFHTILYIHKLSHTRRILSLERLWEELVLRIQNGSLTIQHDTEKRRESFSICTCLIQSRFVAKSVRIVWSYRNKDCVIHTVYSNLIWHKLDGITGFGTQRYLVSFILVFRFLG